MPTRYSRERILTSHYFVLYKLPEMVQCYQKLSPFGRCHAAVPDEMHLGGTLSYC